MIVPRRQMKIPPLKNPGHSNTFGGLLNDEPPECRPLTGEGMDEGDKPTVPTACHLPHQEGHNQVDVLKSQAQSWQWQPHH